MSRKEQSRQTVASFDYQWREFPEGKWLLSDPEWKKDVDNRILDELQTTREEIKGKKVLDVGSGQGRWAYGFLKLGCSVYAVDASETAVAQTNALNYDGNRPLAWQVDLTDSDALKKMFRPNSIDLIWVWGVLHHLPDPEKVVTTLASLLKLGGVLHAYVYGDKGPMIRFWRGVYQQLTFDQRGTLAKMQAEIKEFLQRMPLNEEQKKQLYDVLPWAPSAHSNIDQYSPAIADEYTEDTVRGWFEGAGLTFSLYTPRWANRQSRNIFANGVKKQ